MERFTVEEKLDALQITNKRLIKLTDEYELSSLSKEDLESFKLWIVNNVELEQIESEEIRNDDRIIIKYKDKVINVRPFVRKPTFKTVWEFVGNLMSGNDCHMWWAIMIVIFLFELCNKTLTKDQAFVYCFLEDYCIKNGNDFLDRNKVLNIAGQYSKDIKYRYLDDSELNTILRELEELHLIEIGPYTIFPRKKLTIKF